MIDLTDPVATPFRANWEMAPRTEFEFRTGIITSADGREQRHPLMRYPRVKVSYACLTAGRAHSDRINALLPSLLNRAVAIRDFRLNGVGRVSEDGALVVMREWGASWAPTVRVVIEDEGGLVEYSAVITATDPAARVITLGAPAPEAMRGRVCGVGSAVVASLDDETDAGVWHAGAVSWNVSASSFGGIDHIGGAPRPDLPLSHGADEEMRVSVGRQMSGIDFGIGGRAEALNYASWTSGFRTYQIQANQLSQAQKESLVSFYCGVRGRLRAFSADGLVAGARFRFASDSLVVEHLTGTVSKATISLAQVVQ